jgi:aspartate-semialdehyde dehydrogenase
VRVPVVRCHGESVNEEFTQEVTVEAARNAWKKVKTVEIMDNPKKDLYPMPGMLAGTDPVYIGRTRIDDTVEHGLSFWVVADQIRKGAALNAVEIAQLLLP